MIYLHYKWCFKILTDNKTFSEFVNKNKLSQFIKITHAHIFKFKKQDTKLHKNHNSS